MIFIKDCAIFFLGVLAAGCIGYGILCYVEEIPKFISKRLKKQQRLEKTVQEKDKEIENLISTIKKINKYGYTVEEYEEKLKQFGILWENSKIKQKELELNYENQRKALDKSLEELKNKCVLESNNLQSLKDKQIAYIKEQKRKKEMESKIDYYRPVLTKEEIQDIDELRKLQKNFNNKEVIDKIIWDVYYKTAYNLLCSRIFEGVKTMQGIYKITCIPTGEAYIGQSIDIATRWKSHIKEGISYKSTANKFYKSMKIYNPCNFTFEILENVEGYTKLNEREKYYIDFYQTKDQLNSTKGGS